MQHEWIHLFHRLSREGSVLFKLFVAAEGVDCAVDVRIPRISVMTEQ